MNLVLLEPGELGPDGTARLVGRRARHVLDVLRAEPGAAIRAGVADGRLGEARVLAASAEEVVLAPALDRDPPAASPVDLLVALPRPKILRRVLQAAAAMGVKRIAIVGSFRVEKSYWSSPLLAPAALREQLLLGLEQGRDTAVPEVTLHRFFKPFVEDALDGAFPRRLRLLADLGPGVEPLDPLARAPAMEARAVLAVGPEGGFTAYESAELVRRGFAPFTLGPRPLRVDAAVPFAVGQAELWLRARAARGAPEP